ncbi:MAG TPA: winged helix-turn-helix domain-containing protein [Pseudonocardiaceae bacterium]
MAAELRLALPWISKAPQQLHGLTVGQGHADILRYEDGIELAVHVIDPGTHDTAEQLIAAARHATSPGRVVLVAGALPVSWRPALRTEGVSFLDPAGVAEIRWPRIHVSTGRFNEVMQRTRSALPFQKHHALIVQELLVLTAGTTHRPTVGELSENTGTTLSTASRAVTQLAAHGLAEKHRAGRRVEVGVPDRRELSHLLAQRTSWPRGRLLSGYLWGNSVWDVGSRLSRAAERSGVDIALTGRAGAAYLGVVGTSSPARIRCWTRSPDLPLPEVARRLGLEPAAEDEANVTLAEDRWRLGTHRRDRLTFDASEAYVAHPLRIWCDVHSELRGTEFAAEMWSYVNGR